MISRKKWRAYRAGEIHSRELFDTRTAAVYAYLRKKGARFMGGSGQPYWPDGNLIYDDEVKHWDEERKLMNWVARG